MHDYDDNDAVDDNDVDDINDDIGECTYLL